MREKKGEHPFGDVGQLVALVVFLVVWMGDPFVTFHKLAPPLARRLAER